MHSSWFSWNHIPGWKNHVQLHQEGEAPFKSEVEIAAISATQTQIDAMAQVAGAVAKHWGGENENIEQILWQSVANANMSIKIILSKVSTAIGGILIYLILQSCKHLSFRLTRRTHYLRIWKMWGQWIMQTMPLGIGLIQIFVHM